MKWAVDDAHIFAVLELHPRLGLERALVNLLRQPQHLALGHGRRAGGRADKAGNLGRGLNQMPREVVELHLHQHVAGEELALGRLFLAPFGQLYHILGRDEQLAELGAQIGELNPLLEALLGSILVPRIRVHHVPFKMRVLWQAARRRITMQRGLVVLPENAVRHACPCPVHKS